VSKHPRHEGGDGHPRRHRGPEAITKAYHRQHLCLDRGYEFPEIERGVIERRYVSHVHRRGELENPVKRYRPKRWVVERSASWLNRFRKLLIR